MAISLFIPTFTVLAWKRKAAGVCFLSCKMLCPPPGVGQMKEEERKVWCVCVCVCETDRQTVPGSDAGDEHRTGHRAGQGIPSLGK